MKCRCPAESYCAWGARCLWRWGSGGAEEEREKGSNEPFALHAPIHQAMLGVCEQEKGGSSRLCTPREYSVRVVHLGWSTCHAKS